MAVRVSVAIPVRLAVETVRATLEAAAAQARECEGEVVAAVGRDDPSRPIVEAVARSEAPVVRVVISEELVGVPQLRRDAVRAATGDWVVITEDHCLFPSGWLKAMPGAANEVRGGYVANGRDTYAGWAQYFTRYYSFLPPPTAGPTQHLPGTSACYGRDLLRSESLKAGFWEAELNRELQARGVRLVSDPALTVEQRQYRGWLEFVPLRYRHGRCYGGRRGGSKIRVLLRTPVIPALLLIRAVRAQAAQRYRLGWFLLTLPLLLTYVLAWTVGEFVGGISGAGDSCAQTD